MKAPTYVETSKVKQFQQDIDMRKHQRKLEEIQKMTKGLSLGTEVEEGLKRRKEEKKKTNDFLTQEKNLEINRDNQVLLNKLVEISAGKWSHIKKEKQAGASLIGPKSLNLGFRKKETERIEKENHAFAKRLFDKQAILSKKRLDTEYKNHLQYKKQIQKLKKKKGDKKRMTMGSSGDIQVQQQVRSKSVDNANEGQDEDNDEENGEENNEGDALQKVEEEKQQE